MNSPLSTEYDKIADVLYIVTPQNAPAIAHEDEIGMVWRYAVEGDRLVGLTLIDFDGYWRKHIQQVITEMSIRFGISQVEARKVLESVH